MADQSPASVNTYQLAKDLSDSANLIAAGFRAACAQWPKVVSLWLAGSAVAFAMRAIRLAGGAALKHSSLSTAWIGFHLLARISHTVINPPMV